MSKFPPRDRTQMDLLHCFDSGDEVRTEFDEYGALVVWWFDKQDDGSYECDAGLKVPQEGLRRLTELLVEKL